MVDDQNLDGSLRGFELQAEILLDRVENGWRVVCRLRVFEHLAIYRVFDRRLEVNIVNSGDAGAIDNGTFQGSGEHLGEMADRYCIHKYIEVILTIDIVSAEA